MKILNKHVESFSQTEYPQGQFILAVMALNLHFCLENQSSEKRFDLHLQTLFA